MSEETDPEETEDAGAMDPSVPTDLLDLYVQLDEEGVSPEKFKEAFE